MWHTLPPPQEEPPLVPTVDYGVFLSRAVDISNLEKRLARIHYGQKDFPTIQDLRLEYVACKEWNENLPDLDPKWAYYRIWAHMMPVSQIKTLFPDFPFSAIPTASLENKYATQNAVFQIAGTRDVVSIDFRASELDPIHRWGFTDKGRQRYRVCCMQPLRKDGLDPPGCWIQLDPNKEWGTYYPTKLWFQTPRGRELWQTVADNIWYYDETRFRTFVRDLILKELDKGTVFKSRALFDALEQALQECVDELVDNHWIISQERGVQDKPQLNWPSFSPRVQYMIECLERVNAYTPSRTTPDTYTVYQWVELFTHMSSDKLLRLRSGVWLIRELSEREITRFIGDLGLTSPADDAEIDRLKEFARQVRAFEAFKWQYERFAIDLPLLPVQVNPYYDKKFDLKAMQTYVDDFERELLDYRRKINKEYLTGAISADETPKRPDIITVLDTFVRNYTTDSNFLNDQRGVVPQSEVDKFTPEEQRTQLFAEWKKVLEFALSSSVISRYKEAVARAKQLYQAIMDERAKKKKVPSPKKTATTRPAKRPGTMPPVTPGTVPSTPPVTPSTPPVTPGTVPSTPPVTPATVPPTPATVPPTPGTVPPVTPGTVPSTPPVTPATAPPTPAKVPPTTPGTVPSTPPATPAKVPPRKITPPSGLKRPSATSPKKGPVTIPSTPPSPGGLSLDHYDQRPWNLSDFTELTFWQESERKKPGRAYFGEGLLDEIEFLIEKLKGLYDKKLLVYGDVFWTFLYQHGLVSGGGVLAFYDRAFYKKANYGRRDIAWNYGVVALYAWAHELSGERPVPSWVIQKARAAVLACQFRRLNPGIPDGVPYVPVDPKLGKLGVDFVKRTLTPVPFQSSNALKLFRLEKNSCPFDSFYVLMFHRPGSWIERKIVNAKEMYVPRIVYQNEMDELHEHVLSDIEYVQGTTKVRPDTCLSKKSMLTLFPGIADSNFMSDPLNLLEGFSILYQFPVSTHDVSVASISSVLPLETNQVVVFYKVDDGNAILDMPPSSGQYRLQGAWINVSKHWTAIFDNSGKSNWERYDDTKASLEPATVNEMKVATRWVYFRTDEEEIRALFNTLRNDLGYVGKDIPQAWLDDPLTLGHLKAFRDKSDPYLLDRARIFFLKK